MIRSTYAAPDDPVAANILRVIGDAGIHLWDARLVEAVMVEFERHHCAPISRKRFNVLMRETCPRSRPEPESEDDANVALHIRNRHMLDGILRALESDGKITLGRFKESLAAAQARTTADINLAIEMVRSAMEFPVAGVCNRIGKAN